MDEQYSIVRSNVSMLGTLLGDTIRESLGDAFFERIETIRQLSKSSRYGNTQDHQRLLETLQELSADELLPVAKAFNQFLNLVNTAEQYQSISPKSDETLFTLNIFNQLFTQLQEKQIERKKIEEAIEQLHIDLVLTAHPTEINRRSLINQMVEINNCLAELDHVDLSDSQQKKIMTRLKQLVAQSWFTDEIRKVRPTPIDEAKWGFSVIENSLWHGVPTFVRGFSEQITEFLGYKLPETYMPIQFSSWMGGDRDGNPFVTAKVTQHVLLLGRLEAAQLFLKDIQTLVTELSMSPATDEFRQYVGNYVGDDSAAEPYREVLKHLRNQLIYTIEYLKNRINDDSAFPPRSMLTKNEQIWEPLYQCYKSLHACNMGVIAQGPLLDTMYRVKCFGLQLARLDIRQDSSRHTAVLSEITRYLEMGDYSKWSEEEKQTFLINELNSKRPLLPHHWKPSGETKEVLDTFKVIAETEEGTIATYIISMAQTPSDVLAVCLLLKESECPYYLPITPLFETLNDLNNAETVMQQLFDIEWYNNVIQGKQMVMIGYSDSAKDAGVLAASWAQYRAQDALIKLCDSRNIALTLFHGRGGSTGRGGVPAHAALLSQPPGSLKGGLRVTEQGEMIRFKLGLPQVAVNSLAIYANAILQANLFPPPEPEQKWRDLMDELSAVSCNAYRAVVREHPDFVPYFRSATPEQELSKLPLGSRPSKRRPDGGVESLRAIPWIFAWTQNRLMLPAWLGAGEALEYAVEQGHRKLLEQMCREWPFFLTRIGMLEMVYSKTDLSIAQYYDQRLVDESLWTLGQDLRNRLSRDIKLVLEIAHDEQLMQTLPWIAQSIFIRNIYTDPLNLLQVELLHRIRHQVEPDSQEEQALMVTISGIAAGMRNTG